MHERRVILVTGAPRSGTTPVGNTLELSRRSAAFYEPLGPTGLRRVRTRFPMRTDSDLSAEELEKVIFDIRDLRGPLHSQTRPYAKPTLRSRTVGSRTLQSLRIARLKPGVRQIIWKDPHAVMLVPDLLRRGIPCVVTVRSAPAQAASYARLGWLSRAPEIFERWSERFGQDAIAERHLKEAQSDVIVSAALVWRMCYRAVLSSAPSDKLHIVHADQLAHDEEGVYRALLSRLDLAWSPRLDRHFRKRRAADGAAIPKTGQTHDWSRSVAAANAYWREILSDDQIALVRALTEDVESELMERLRSEPA